MGPMLKYAIIFFVISLITGFLGFGNVSAATGRIAKVLFFIVAAIFILFVVLIVLGIQAFT